MLMHREVGLSGLLHLSSKGEDIPVPATPAYPDVAYSLVQGTHTRTQVPLR